MNLNLLFDRIFSFIKSVVLTFTLGIGCAHLNRKEPTSAIEVEPSSVTKQPQKIRVSFWDENGKLLFQRDISAQSQLSVAQVTNLSLKDIGESQLEGQDCRSSTFSPFKKAPMMDQVKDVQRHFGWCYRVDSEVPHKMAEEKFIELFEKEIMWFYSYAEKINGEWGRTCVSVINPDKKMHP